MVSRLAAKRHQNFSGTAGVGALLFLRAVEISDFARDLWHRQSAEHAAAKSYHPTCEERVQALRGRLEEAFCPDYRWQMATIWEFYDSLSFETNRFVRALLPKLLGRAADS